MAAAAMTIDTHMSASKDHTHHSNSTRNDSINSSHGSNSNSHADYQIFSPSLDRPKDDMPTSSSARPLRHRHSSSKKNIQQERDVQQPTSASATAPDMMPLPQPNSTPSTDAKEAMTTHISTLPKRAMLLTGMPMPALPPPPVFPAELESALNNTSSHQLAHLDSAAQAHYSRTMESYLKGLREDHQRQLKNYERLKAMVQEDQFYSTTVVAELDAMDEDPFTLDSFENLMRLHANKGKDFLLARVTTQDPNEEGKVYYSYYGAHQINKVLFRTQPDEGLLHRMKARNPLNNMLVVGDVHYYIISAEDINAIKPLPTTTRPSASSSPTTSHSSRMSRCSKLAAQAIASQSSSARSSPILGNDGSLFLGPQHQQLMMMSNSHPAENSTLQQLESPVSIIPSEMALSILQADQGDLQQRHPSIITASAPPTASPPQSACASPGRRGSWSPSGSASSTPTVGQSGFQPTKPSRLRQAIHAEDDQDHEQTCSASDPPPATNSNHTPGGRSGGGGGGSQSPLFQNLMTSNNNNNNTVTTIAPRTTRSRSSTLSSISSHKSTFSSHSHISQCSTASHLSTPSSPSTTSSSSSSSSGGPIPHEKECPAAVYRFRYLASDDDFLLRSAIRQTFKQNALESWDAILFTISQNALLEYQNPGQPPHQQRREEGDERLNRRGGRGGSGGGGGGVESDSSDESEDDESETESESQVQNVEQPRPERRGEENERRVNTSGGGRGGERVMSALRDQFQEQENETGSQGEVQNAIVESRMPATPTTPRTPRTPMVPRTAGGSSAASSQILQGPLPMTPRTSRSGGGGSTGAIALNQRRNDPLPPLPEPTQRHPLREPGPLEYIPGLVRGVKSKLRVFMRSRKGDAVEECR